MLNRYWVAAAAWGCLVHCALAAAPSIARVDPPAAVAGGTTEITFVGDNLDGGLDVWTSFPCEVSPGERPGAPVFRLTIAGKVPRGLGALRLITTNGISNPQLFLIDSLPTASSGGTNHSLATARKVTVPGAFHGVCEEVRSDFYKLGARKGDRLTMEIVAQRTGSALDPVLRLLDTRGLELAANDDTPELGGDARLEFRCPKTGEYIVEVRDTRYAGGPRYGYQLRLGKALPTPLPFLAGPDLTQCAASAVAPDAVPEREPNDAPAQAQQVPIPVEVAGGFAKAGDRDLYQFHVNQGERLLFTGRTRSLASPCDLFLRLETTNGVKVAQANASSADEGLLTNRFEREGTYRLVVEELNRLGGPKLTYRLTVQPLPPGFSLSTETERVSVPAGDSFELEVKAERRDYDGPIRLALNGLTDRFTITNVLMAPKTNTARIKVTVPPDFALGDLLHFSVSGTATIGGTDFIAASSTLPALRNVFPELRYPPRELDGAIALSIAASKSATASPQKKRKK